MCIRDRFMSQSENDDEPRSVPGHRDKDVTRFINEQRHFGPYPKNGSIVQGKENLQSETNLRKQNVWKTLKRRKRRLIDL